MRKNTLKYSGIFWLGNIPDTWEIKRIKDLSYTQSGTTPSTNVVDYYENGKYNWIRTTDLNNAELFETEYKVTDLAIDKCRLSFLPIDTVLIAMYGGFGTIGKNAIIKRPSTINQSVCAILPNYKRIDPNYLMFFLKYFRNNWRLFADGARKDPNINQDAVKNLFVIYPPLTEQIEIANYLLNKTNAIDRKIELLEQKIINYQQLRKSLINETVCRGLDKNVKLKDSGIEWIGMIPEHWEVKRFKDKFNLFTGNSIADKSLFENKNNSLDYISTKDIDVETGEIVYDNGLYIPKNNKSFKIAKANSILLCLEGGNAGKKVGFNLKNVCFVNKLCSIKGKTRNVNEKYQFYCIQSLIFERQFFAIMNGLIGGVSLNLVKLFNILYPPLSEQIAIANFLDEKTQNIDSIVTNLRAQIETLKELRKTLINDVVTGKIKVSGIKEETPLLGRRRTKDAIFGDVLGANV